MSFDGYRTEVATGTMHPALLPGWKAPDTPTKYPDLTAIKFVAEFGQHFRWHLDFSRVDHQSPVERFFASDAEKCPVIEWPWREGANPSEEDWIAIGFTVIVMTDLSSAISVSSAEVAVFAETALFDAVAACGKATSSTKH